MYFNFLHYNYWTSSIHSNEALHCSVYVSLIDHSIAMIRARYLFTYFLSFLRYMFFTNFVRSDVLC